MSPREARRTRTMSGDQEKEFTGDYKHCDARAVHASLFYIPVIMNQQEILAIIDTGAEVNVIGETLAKQIGLTHATHATQSIKGCNNASSVGKHVIFTITLAHGQKVFCHALEVAELECTLLLGTPFLDAVKAEIDFGANVFTTTWGSVAAVRQKYARVLTIMIDEVSVTDRDLLDKTMKNVEDCVSRERVKNLLLKYKDLWINERRGLTNVLECHLEMNTDRPIRQGPRRFAAEQLQIIDEEVKKMLDAGVIQLSHSPHVQEVVLVKKKSGEWRFCIDFRKLNQHLIFDNYPLPRIQDLLRHVQHARFFCSLDLRAGYWQIPMAPTSMPLTAFRASLYEHKVMPFGLKTAPAVFSRLMDIVMGDLYWKGVGVYLDDILIYGRTQDEVFELLEEVFVRLGKANLTLSLKKCTFFQSSTKYLGYIINDGRLEPDPEKVEALQHIRKFEDAKDIRAFLRCVGYFRTFIPNFSHTAEPLTRLLRKNVKFKWGPAQ